MANLGRCVLPMTTTRVYYYFTSKQLYSTLLLLLSSFSLSLPYTLGHTNQLYPRRDSYGHCCCCNCNQTQAFILFMQWKKGGPLSNSTSPRVSSSFKKPITKQVLLFFSLLPFLFHSFFPLVEELICLLPLCLSLVV